MAEKRALLTCAVELMDRPWRREFTEAGCQLLVCGISGLHSTESFAAFSEVVCIRLERSVYGNPPYVHCGAPVWDKLNEEGARGTSRSPIHRVPAFRSRPIDAGMS